MKHKIVKYLKSCFSYILNISSEQRKVKIVAITYDKIDDELHSITPVFPKGVGRTRNATFTSEGQF